MSLLECMDEILQWGSGPQYSVTLPVAMVSVAGAATLPHGLASPTSPPFWKSLSEMWTIAAPLSLSVLLLFFLLRHLIPSLFLSHLHLLGLILSPPASALIAIFHSPPTNGFWQDSPEQNEWNFNGGSGSWGAVGGWAWDAVLSESRWESPQCQHTSSMVSCQARKPFILGADAERLNSQRLLRLPNCALLAWISTVAHQRGVQLNFMLMEIKWWTACKCEFYKTSFGIMFRRFDICPCRTT